MRYLLPAVILFVMMMSPSAYGLSGCEEDCSKCHSLDKGEAEQILTKMKVTDANVSGIKMSPIRGLWEVSFESRGRRDILYVDFSKKQIVKGPIVSIDSPGSTLEKKPDAAALAARQQQKFVDMARIPLENSLVLGDRNAGHKVVVFTDPDCPYCARLHEELKKVIAENNDIVFYLKLMPLKMHPDSRWKSLSIMCSGSMQLLEENFQKKVIPGPQCETKVIDENLGLAAELGITGTPTIILHDGLVVSGMRDARALRDLIITHSRRDS